MKRYLVNAGFFPTLILFIVFSLSIAGCSGADDNAINVRPVEADEFAPFIVTSFDGKEIDIGSMRGHVVVINFWASWCGPCKTEAKDIEKVYRRYKGKGVKFIGIAVDDTVDNARDFIELHEITYPNAFDVNDQLASEYEVFVVPTTYVLDREGWLTYTHKGAISRGRLENAIDRVL